METGVEVNSLSLQSAEMKKPAELIVPKVVTDTMLGNCKKALELLNQHVPNVKAGISLHAGSVIDIKAVENSDIPITSLDVPDLAYPKETIKTVTNRPSDILNHIAWRLNSTIGWSKSDALRQRENIIKKSSNLEPFSLNPFIRISLDNDTSQLESFLHQLPSNYIVGIEYNAESQFSIEQYLQYVKNLNKVNSNIGLSIDPAHLYEYFAINITNPNPEESTMNILDNIFYDSNNEAVLSLDINNISPNTKTYGKTHKLFERGVLGLDHIVDSYKKYINAKNQSGRVCIEFSPKDISLFLDSNSNAALMSTIQKFS